MLPLGSEGGFHFRMIWDEELETEMGSKGTDGTARVGKEAEVTSPPPLRESCMEPGPDRADPDTQPDAPACATSCRKARYSICRNTFLPKQSSKKLRRYRTIRATKQKTIYTYFSFSLAKQH